MAKKAKMSQKRFWEELAKIAHRFHLTDGAVRMKKTKSNFSGMLEEVCPISGVCNIVVPNIKKEKGGYYTLQIDDPAEAMGLDSRFANAVAVAADTDYLSPFYDGDSLYAPERKMRTKLLNVLGLLKEKKAKAA